MYLLVYGVEMVFFYGMNNSRMLYER